MLHTWPYLTNNFFCCNFEDQDSKNTANSYSNIQFLIKLSFKSHAQLTICWIIYWYYDVLDFSKNLNVPIHFVTPSYGIKCYLKSISIDAGFSRYDFHRLENLAIVAPSITLWSADQLTLTTCALYTLSFSSNFGTSCMRSYKTSCNHRTCLV